MSSILYYSNFCEHSKKLLQIVGKTKLSKDIHFICIDKRVKDNKHTYIILANEQKIIMPENVTKVPALLLLSQNYKVLYGEDIYNFFKPMEQVVNKQATQNNIDPMAFSFNSGGFGIVSDNYSFLDMNDSELAAIGNGGLRQMHNYVGLNDGAAISTPKDEYDYKSGKISEDLTVEKLQKQRDNDMSHISYNK
jgi:hypothetical protein